MNRLLPALVFSMCIAYTVTAQNEGPMISVTTVAKPAGKYSEPQLLVMLQLDDQKKVEVAQDGTQEDLLGSEHIPLHWIESITLVTDRLELEPYGEKARDGILLITLKEGWKESELFKRYQ